MYIYFYFFLIIYFQGDLEIFYEIIKNKYFKIILNKKLIQFGAIFFKMKISL